MKTITVEYRCDQCGKKPPVIAGALIVSFGGVDGSAGAYQLPDDIHVCGWDCLEKWINKYNRKGKR